MIDISWILSIWSLTGNIFNIKKKVICFYIWGIGEIMWMIFDIHNKTYGRAFLDLTQLFFAILGIYEWQFKRKKMNKIENSENDFKPSNHKPLRGYEQ